MESKELEQNSSKSEEKAVDQSNILKKEDDKEKPLELQFNNFYDLDELLKGDKGILLKNEKMESKVKKSENFNIKLRIIKKLFDSINIQSIDEAEYLFTLDQILYQHRDFVFLGHYYQDEMDSDDLKYPCFIKCYNFQSDDEAEAVESEVELYVKLLNKSKEYSGNNKFLNDILFYFYDFQNGRFYILFEYSDSSLLEEIKREEKEKNGKSSQFSGDFFDNNKKKFKKVRKMLEFLIFLHSNGVLHRDIKMEYFLHEQNHEFMTFDLTNAVDLFRGVDSSEIDDKKTIPDYKRKIYNELKNKTFMTPKFVPPEINMKTSHFSYAQDIWAFGCFILELFEDYTKENKRINFFSPMKIFHYQFISNIKNRDNYKDEEPCLTIPQINKSMDKGFAQIINKCFERNYRKRIDIIKLYKDLIPYLKRADCNFQINHEEENTNAIISLKNFCGTLNRIKIEYEKTGIEDFTIEETDKDNEYINQLDIQIHSANERNYSNIFQKCKEHTSLLRNIYCEVCNIVICGDCLKKMHKGHSYKIIGGKKETSEKGKKNKKEEINEESGEYLADCIKTISTQLDELEKIYINPSFLKIETFSTRFNKDYNDQKTKIENKDKDINGIIDSLKALQLNNLENSKKVFLDSKFNKIFSESERTGKFCQRFYQNKTAFFSHYDRFNGAFIMDEITKDNFKIFKKKWELFQDSAELLRITANELKEKCEGLRIPGKYIYREQQYTDDINNFLNTIENNIKNERHKFYDYSDQSAIYIEQEFLMVIPRTSTLFAFSKNSFKKIKADFNQNKLKFSSFLPGCATIHKDKYFLITGGEIKDEATSSFIYLDLEKNSLDEGIEMNFTRRFHSMLNISCLKGTYLRTFVCVIGGWDIKEVEIMETTDNRFDKWLILPSMNNCRADASTLFFNSQYIYVFGGWDYNLKKNISEIERYEIFNDYNLKMTKQWETIKIRGDSSLLEKYNMGIIRIHNNEEEMDLSSSKNKSESFLIVGGFNDNYDYSDEVFSMRIENQKNYVTITKEPQENNEKEEDEEKNADSKNEEDEIKKKQYTLPMKCSFWYEKEFHYAKNEIDGKIIAINFNCFNNLLVFDTVKKTFTQFGNSNTKL